MLPLDRVHAFLSRGLISVFWVAITINQSINQSKRIYIAPYVAGESEARVGLG